MRNEELTMTFLGGVFAGSFIAVSVVWMFGINAGAALICVVPIGMAVYSSLKK